MPHPFSSLLLFFFLLCPGLWSYEIPEEKQDAFAKRVCPAFLIFVNVVNLDGATVELPCKCKPEQVKSVVWFHRTHMRATRTRALTDSQGNKPLDPSEFSHSASLQSRFSIRLFSLVIFRVSVLDAGIYICGSSDKDFFYGYDLDIQKAPTIVVAPRLTSRDKTSDTEDLGSVEPFYRIFIGFRPWSVCDRCGERGEQIRVGFCYVYSRFLHVRFIKAKQRIASCGSEAIPRALRPLSQSKVEAKIEVRSCQVACPSQPSDSGTVKIPVFYMNHPADRVLTLGCPGVRPNMAVAWDRGSKPIYRSEHSVGHDPPLSLQIDTGHHLVFNPARIQDSAIYICWLQGHKAAEIRLLVYAHFGSKQSLTSHPEFPQAMRTVLISYAVMTVVFCVLLLVRTGVRIYMDARETHVD